MKSWVPIRLLIFRQIEAGNNVPGLLLCMQSAMNVFGAIVSLQQAALVRGL